MAGFRACFYTYYYWKTKPKSYAMFRVIENYRNVDSIGYNIKEIEMKIPGCSEVKILLNLSFTSVLIMLESCFSFIKLVSILYLICKDAERMVDV